LILTVSISSQDLRARLLRRVPDQPGWVETRGLLLLDRSEIWESDGGYVVRDPKFQLIALIGRRRLSTLARVLGQSLEPSTLITAIGDFDYVAEELPEFEGGKARIGVLPPGYVFSSGPEKEGRIRRVSSSDRGRFGGLPLRLQREVGERLGESPMMAAFVEGKPVSFCYAHRETETLWDVSIETLEQFQRRGLAMRCFNGLASWMAKERRKLPVWGAMEDNMASILLAEKLGFMWVTELAVFEEAR
jgi:GNAT superfamily N-acetyltransferase